MCSQIIIFMPMLKRFPRVFVCVAAPLSPRDPEHASGLISCVISTAAFMPMFKCLSGFVACIASLPTCSGCSFPGGRAGGLLAAC